MDTGASRSFIGEKVYNEIRKHNLADLKPINMMARFADGRRSEILGTVDLEIFFHGKILNVTFRVLPDLDLDMIFGLDILSAVGYQFDYDKIASTDDESWRSEDEDIDDALREISEQLKSFNEIKGPTTVGKHTIKLKKTEPINLSYSPRNPAMQKVMYDELDDMLAKDVIEPSSGPWCSPIVITKRKDGSYRFCIDFRKINAISERDAYPIPQINSTLDKLRNSKFFSKIDLRNGYWNIPLAEESRPITAFVVPGRGLFQFKVMPFGLHSATATFQRIIEKVLGPELGVYAFVYLDDVIVLGKTVEDHLENVRRILERLRDANLRVNPEKSEFFKRKIHYLGHMVDENGIHTDPEKVKSILNFQTPKNVTELRRFMGIISWCRRFIPDCSTLTQPLTRLLQKKNQWEWGPEQNEVFETLKKKLSSAPILAPPDFSVSFCLQTDASQYGLGIVLTQIQNDQEVVIAYASRTLNKAEQNYSVTEKECLAIVWGISKMRYYLEGYSFTVLTDHASLRWLQTISSPTGRLARWNVYLQQFDFTIKFRKGKSNLVADALSRDLNTNENHTEDFTDETAFVIDVSDQCVWYRNLSKAVSANPDRYPDFSVKDGLLYRHLHHSLNFTDRDKAWKLCVPEPLRRKVLSENHDAPTAGHLGIAKTIARITENYYWPGMNGDISRYVRNCVSCQEFKTSQGTIHGKMGTCNASQPWEYVSMDIVGPLVRSSRGNKYLVVLQDKFTKWVELHPIREQKTKSIIQVLKDKIILRFGCPRILITDNGSQFRAKDFEKLVNDFNISHQRTPPYSPQCNPVERTNKTIKIMIAQFIEKNQKSWDNWLPELQFAYNTAKHESTQFSPAYLNYQRTPQTPFSLKTSVEKEFPRKTLSVEKLKETQELVRVNLARAFTQQSSHYNRRRKDWSPAIGDRVAKKERPLSSAIDNFAAKLAPRYSGNYVVKNIISRTIVEIQDVTGKLFKIHVKDLKPFHAAEETTSTSLNA